MKLERAFTLVELTIVVTLLAILGVVAIAASVRSAIQVYRNNEVVSGRASGTYNNVASESTL